MNTTKSRKQYDDFELKDNYDFTGAVRRLFYKPKKIPATGSYRPHK